MTYGYDPEENWSRMVEMGIENVTEEIAAMVRREGKYNPEQAVGSGDYKLWDICFLIESDDADFWSVFDEEHASNTGDIILLPGVTAEQAAIMIETSESIGAIITEKVSYKMHQVYA